MTTYTHKDYRIVLTESDRGMDVDIYDPSDWCVDGRSTSTDYSSVKGAIARSRAFIDGWSTVVGEIDSLLAAACERSAVTFDTKPGEFVASTHRGTVDMIQIAEHVTKGKTVLDCVRQLYDLVRAE